MTFGTATSMSAAAGVDVGVVELPSRLFLRLNQTTYAPSVDIETLNFYAVNPNPQGHPDVFLVDLPGYGYAKVSKAQRAQWQQFIGRYVTERAEEGVLKAVVQLVDSRHGMTKMDEELLAIMRESPAPHLIALTKSDKLTATKRQQAVGGIRDYLAPYGLELPTILTSSEKKQGIGELWSWIDTVLV